MYYDQLTSACAPAPPQPCAGCSDGDLCPDPTTCSKYHGCYQGKSVSVYECSDSSNTKFNYKTKKCDGTEDEVCDPRIQCKISNIGGSGSGSTGSGTATTTGTGSVTGTTGSGSGSSSSCNASTVWAMSEDTADCKR